MPFDSVGVAEERRSIWGRGEGATNTWPSRFPNEIAKTAQTCPEFCMRFYLRWSNTKNIIFLSLMLSDCSFSMLLCELP